MKEPTTHTSLCVAAFILRFYGIICAGFGLAGLKMCFTLKPGYHGVADWFQGWPNFTIFVLLGIGVFLLLRWLVFSYVVISASFGVYCIYGSLRTVPFPWEIANLIIAAFFMLPAFLIYHAWLRLQ